MTTSATVIILGACGDLTQRLLLPGLASLLSTHAYDVQLLGSSIEDCTDAHWHDLVRRSFGQVSDQSLADACLASARYIRADATNPNDLRALLGVCHHPPVLYFALPPAVTARVCAALQQVELPEGTRLALEKPFGVDLNSARALNRLIDVIVPEQQVFRIDHFLGMSKVLNILGLRFANQFLEPIWNADHIERVDIVYDETLGLEGRADYYDRAGALVDMVQSHLLEVLALVAMEQPPKLNEVELRGNAAQVLRSTRVRDSDPVTSSRRARYTTGEIDGVTMRGYADEPAVDVNRNTETLAQVTVEIDTPRWRGVPFVLRSGKALGQHRKQVRITMKPVAPIPGFLGAPARDAIVLELKSGDVSLTINGSGDSLTLDQRTLIAESSAAELPPYSQVLRGVLDGDPLLSVRGDVAEECWRIVEPVIDSWRADDVPLEEYAAGSSGPGGWVVT